MLRNSWETFPLSNLVLERVWVFCCFLFGFMCCCCCGFGFFVCWFGVVSFFGGVVCLLDFCFVFLLICPFKKTRNSSIA